MGSTAEPGLMASAQTSNASREIDQTYTEVIDGRGEPWCADQWDDPGRRQLRDGTPEDGDICMAVEARWVDDAVGKMLVLVECKRPGARKDLTRGKLAPPS